MSKRILSIDIPWGSANYLGAASAELENGRLAAPPQVVVIDTGSIAAGAVGQPPFPHGDPEVVGFIANGAGPNRAMPADAVGPHPNGFPANPPARQQYLQQIWGAFHQVRALLAISKVELVLVDVPLAPAELMAQVAAGQWASRYRPVESAFRVKVWIPGANPKRQDGRVQFACFQPGLIPGCRPGYALCRLASLAFAAHAAAESFPQLTLGALAEYAEHNLLARISRLAAHKTGPAASRAAAQAIIDTQFQLYLGGALPVWPQANLPDNARPDGYDAILGLLPGLAALGYIPPQPVPGHWGQAVILCNHVLPHPPFPVAQGAGQPTAGSAAWLGAPAFPVGIDDTGVLALRLNLWA